MRKRGGDEDSLPTHPFCPSLCPCLPLSPFHPAPACPTISSQVRELLQRVSDYMRRNRAGLQALFSRFDSNRTGQLDPTELLNLMRAAIPSLTDRELR